MKTSGGYMIKAVVFLDDTLNHYLSISNALEKVQTPLTRFIYIDAQYGYTNTQECIQSILEDETYKKLEVIVITNSLIVFNDSRLKEAVCDGILLKNYFILDHRNYELRRVEDLTKKELHTEHNLEKLYINNGFEKLYDAM